MGNDEIVSHGEWTHTEVGESLDTSPQKLRSSRDNTYDWCEPEEPESSLAYLFKDIDMTAENFAYWLQGLFELQPDLKNLTEAQVVMIRQHLGYVFNKPTQNSNIVLPAMPSYPYQTPQPKWPYQHPSIGVPFNPSDVNVVIC